LAQVRLDTILNQLKKVHENYNHQIMESLEISK
jgi:chromosome segregation ATPase